MTEKEFRAAVKKMIEEPPRGPEPCGPFHPDIVKWMIEEFGRCLYCEIKIEDHK